MSEHVDNAGDPIADNARDPIVIGDAHVERDGEADGGKLDDTRAWHT